MLVTSLLVLFSCRTWGYERSGGPRSSFFSSVLWASRISKLSVDRVAQQTQLARDPRWWSGALDEEGVKFGCTGCGRCCQNDGVVWLDTDEFADLCESLKMKPDDVLDRYTEEVMSGWVKLKNKPDTLSQTGNDRCIFLSDVDGKSCTIYESRPVQCRTYPYWPKLLFNSSTFNSQAVVPDDSSAGPHWSAATGGCEGINHVNSTRVSSTIVYRNSALYETYTDSFPFMNSGDDRSRLLSRLGLISGVSRSSRAWVQDFVLKYSLCPFANEVFSSNRIRFRVYLGSSEVDKIIERVRYEMLALLTANENDVATTLLMLPFSFGNFDEWHQFTLALEDAVMPLLEQELLGPQATEGRKKRRLVDKLSNGKSSSSPGTVFAPVPAPVPPPDIQLAFFHPSFTWSESEEFNDPLNFEKRAPFPTINLLRAATIRAWANESKTKKIARGNREALEGAGADELNTRFERIIRLALE